MEIIGIYYNILEMRPIFKYVTVIDMNWYTLVRGMGMIKRVGIEKEENN